MLTATVLSIANPGIVDAAVENQEEYGKQIHPLLRCPK
jgi:hypothetical protein